jgi:hypothetical protein
MLLLIYVIMNLKIKLLMRIKIVCLFSADYVTAYGYFVINSSML